jgi:hypothetical protein
MYLLRKIFDNPEYFRLAKCDLDFFVWLHQTSRQRGDSIINFFCSPEEAYDTAAYLEQHRDRNDLLDVFLHLFGKSESADAIVIPIIKYRAKQRHRCNHIVHRICEYVSTLESPEIFSKFFSEIIEKYLPLDNRDNDSVQICTAIVANKRISGFPYKFLKKVIIRKWKFVRPEILLTVFPPGGGVRVFEPGILELYFGIWADKTPQDWIKSNFHSCLWPIEHTHETATAYKSFLSKMKFSQPIPGIFFPDMLSVIFRFSDDRSLRKAGRVSTQWFQASTRCRIERWEAAEAAGISALVKILSRRPEPFRGSCWFIHPVFAKEEIFQFSMKCENPDPEFREFLLNSGFSASQ